MYLTLPAIEATLDTVAARPVAIDRREGRRQLT
jgi:hypothetical protein